MNLRGNDMWDFYSDNDSSIEHGITKIGWVLIHSIWLFTVIGLVGLTIARTMRTCSAQARYQVLLGSLCLFAASPVFVWSVLDIEVDRNAKVTVERGIGTATEVANGVTNLGQSESPSRFENINPIDERLSSPELSSMILEMAKNEREVSSDGATFGVNASGSATWGQVTKELVEASLPWLVTVWCLGVIFFSVRPLWSWLVVRRLRTYGVSAVSSEVHEMLMSLAARFGIRRSVQVLQSTIVHSPIVVGCVKSVVLLPVSLVTSLPASQLEAILAHELVHVRRYDYLINLLQTIVETVFFYHPMTWLISYQIRLEREHACDDFVVAKLGNKLDYSRALLAVEEHRISSSRESILVLGAAGNSLLSRIRRIALNAPSEVPRSFPYSSFIVLVVVVAFGVGVTLRRDAVAQKPVESVETISTERFVATLPNGQSVELLGFTKNACPVNEGWRPDGELLSKSEEDWAGKVAWIGDSSYSKLPPGFEPEPYKVDFLFRLRNLKARPTLSFDSPSYHSFYPVPDFGDTMQLRVSSRLHENYAELDNVVASVKLTDEPWGEWVEVSIDNGRVLNPEAIHDRYRLQYESIQVLGVTRESDVADARSPGLLLEQRADHQDQYAIEVRGIDSTGKAINPLSGRFQQRGDSKEHCWYLVQDSQLDDGKNLVRYEFRLRPYRFRVNFRNISLIPGKKTKVEVDIEELTSIGIATQAGNWSISDQASLEIKQELVHATDVSTSGIIRLKDANGSERIVPIWIAGDYFANRERWKVVWEEGKSTLWLAKGLAEGPGRNLKPGEKVAATEIRSIHFENPRCIEHRSFDGWVKGETPSKELTEALEKEFEIKAEGQESSRYFEASVKGTADDAVEHLFVWLGNEGRIQIENLTWAPDGPREIKTTFASFAADLQKVMETFRENKGKETPVYLYLSAKKEVPLTQLNTICTACSKLGIVVPEFIHATGEIRGRLLNSLGNPVVGATVACGEIYREDGGSGGTSAVTDEEGRYRLAVPSPGVYVAFLKSHRNDPSWIAAADEGLRVVAGKITESSMALVQGVRVHGRIIDSNGKPRSKTTVMCYSAARPFSLGGVHSATTSENGQFEFYLPAGPSRIYATASIESEAGSKQRVGVSDSVDLVVGDKPTEEIELKLEPSPRIQFGSGEWLARSTPGTEIVSQANRADVFGVVVDENGAPIRNAEIYWPDSKVTRTDGEGRFRVEVEKGNQFIMHAYAPGFQVWFGTPTAGDELKIVMIRKRTLDANTKWNLPLGPQFKLLQVTDGNDANAKPTLAIQLADQAHREKEKRPVGLTLCSLSVEPTTKLTWLAPKVVEDLEFADRSVVEYAFQGDFPVYGPMTLVAKFSDAPSKNLGMASATGSLPPGVGDMESADESDQALTAKKLIQSIQVSHNEAGEASVSIQYLPGVTDRFGVYVIPIAVDGTRLLSPANPVYPNQKEFTFAIERSELEGFEISCVELTQEVTFRGVQLKNGFVEVAGVDVKELTSSETDLQQKK